MEAGGRLRVRAARRDELGKVQALLEAAFDEAAPSVFRAQTQQDSTFRLRDARVALRGVEVVGYVRVFRRTMLVRGVPTPAGGIGSVATREDARGRGVATALLDDAIGAMRRGGMALSFLFTGIPGFYERLGYRVAPQVSISADAGDAALLPDAGLWTVRVATPADVGRSVAIYRRAIAGSTGAVLRTPRTWRDAQAWLGEDAEGCFVAERAGAVAGYARTRCRASGHEILEVETAAGHEGALAPLVAAVGRRAAGHGEPVTMVGSRSHPLATMLRSLATARVEAPAHPMMVLALDPARGAGVLDGDVSFRNADRI